jgi:hypothetical protein
MDEFGLHFRMDKEECAAVGQELTEKINTLVEELLLATAHDRALGVELLRGISEDLSETLEEYRLGDTSTNR